jgi:hypothetical protein
MSQLTTMLNARVAGAWGNDTGDYRGRAPGYFFKLTCVSSGNNVSYTISYEAFTQSNVYSLASRVRSNTATESDYSLLWRLQTSYGYDIGMNLYREYLFLTDPIHSARLSDAQLQEALGLMKASNEIPKNADSALVANTFEIYMAYSAALSEMTYDELFGSLHAMSILQAAGSVSNFVIDLKNYVAEYKAAYNYSTLYNLDPSIRNAFGPDAKVTTLKRATTVYRYYSGTPQSSRWYTPYQVDNPVAELALPPGNTAEHMDTVTLPRGTRIIEGTVAPQWDWGQPGGGYQYYVLP